MCKLQTILTAKDQGYKVALSSFSTLGLQTSPMSSSRYATAAQVGFHTVDIVLPETVSQQE